MEYDEIDDLFQESELFEYKGGKLLIGAARVDDLNIITDHPSNAYGYPNFFEHMRNMESRPSLKRCNSC
jgi:hypothetical protein